MIWILEKYLHPVVQEGFEAKGIYTFLPIKCLKLWSQKQEMAILYPYDYPAG